MKLLCDKCKREYEAGNEFFETPEWGEEKPSDASTRLCPNCIEDSEL